MTLETLQRQAKQSAENRGHTLGRWTTNRNDEHDTALATCIHCGHFVQCDTRPLPNGIDIGGTAVARNCTRQSFPFTTPQEITAAAEAFAVQLDNHEPSATQQRRAIMLALQSATAAQALRFIVALEREFSSVDKAPQFYTVLRNITRTIEGV